MNTTDDQTVRVELAVRTLAPSGCQERQGATIRRLEGLADRGAVDEFEVNVWGKRVGLTTADAGTDHARRVLDAVESFRGWADDHGVSVDRFFETRTVDSAYTGESFTALELPSMVLAEYHDGDLHWVSPCVDGDSTCTVADRLEMLERAGADHTAPAPDPIAPPVAEE